MANPAEGVMIGGNEPPSGPGTSLARTSTSLPTVITQAQSGLQTIYYILGEIESRMASIASKATAFSSAMSGGQMSGSPMSIGGSSSTSNGMPVRGVGTGTQQPSPGGAAGHGFLGTAASAIGGGLVAGGYRAASVAVQGSYANSILFQRLATASNQPFGQGGSQYQQLHSLYANGATGSQDLLDYANNMFNMGWGSSVLNPGVAGANNQFAQNTNNTLSQTQQIQAGLISNPQTLIQARAFGITPLTARGGPQSIQNTVSQVLKATWGGVTPSKSAAQTALTPYGPLRQSFEHLGLTDDQISSLSPSIENWAANGGGNFNFSGSNPLAATGREKASSQIGLASKQFDTLAQSLEAVNKASATLNNALGSQGWLMKTIAVLKGVAAGPGSNMDGHSTLGGVVSNVANDLFLKHLISPGSKLFGGVAKGGGDALPDLLGGGVAAGAGGAALAGSLALPAAAIASSFYLINKYGSSHPVAGGPQGGRSNQNEAHVGDPVAMGGGLGLGASNASNNAAPSGTSASAGSVIGFAEKQIGTPYSWGGGGTNGPSVGIDQGSNTVGFDCSGFVQYVFAHFGVMLPRTTQEQVKCGQPVKAADVQPGDLVFFNEADGPNGHVGIALSANRFINAPHTGTSVQIDNYDVRTCSNIRRVMNVGSGGTTVSNAGSDPNALTNSLLSATQASAMAAANVLGMNGVGMSGGGQTVGAVGSSSRGTSPGTVGNTNVSGSLTPTTFARRLLQAINRPTTASNVAAISAWEAQEGGNWHNDARYNPLNTTMPMPGYHKVGTQGDIGAYNSWSQGLDATALTLENGKYSGILRALQGGSAQAVANAVASSPWGTGHFNVPGYRAGAWKIARDEIAQVHEGEMVLPKQVASAVRDSAGANGKTVVINAHFQDASEAQARRLIRMVEDHFEEKNHLDRIGVA